MAPRAGLGQEDADRAAAIRAVWDRLPPEVRALVIGRLSAEEQADLAVTSRTAWAEDAAARLACRR